MGGKRKQVQRTKGNTRPSSSGRTAEKLAASGSSVAGFVGFTGLQVDPIFTPSAQGNEDVDATVDADFRLTMRKMTKRDVTTRLKAIQEFSSLCHERPSEQILGSLSFWPRLFNKLSMDNDRRVREALFQAHEKLVVRMRKNLAPYLKIIMGSWLVAHCDPYAPAASAAETAFKSAFPPAKQAEAIAFCKVEVVTLLDDNLFRQTPLTLSASDTTKEDRESKYIRIISSSLLAWRLLLISLPKNEHESLMDAYNKMLSEAKFWKLPKHESPLVRSAWFRLVSTLCQIVPSILNDKASKLCPVVLSCLDEANPAVSSVVWEAAMYVLVTVDDCWKHVNARKAVLPKLWAVLQEGGHGNANVIYPNLLPLLNKVPADVMGDPVQFYTEFFNRMRKGLSLPRVQASVSELDSVLSAFVECLKYLITKNIDNSDLRLEQLVGDQLLPVIQSSLLEESSKLNSSVLYSVVSDLLRYLYNSRKNHGSYVALQTHLWAQLETMSKEILQVEEEDSLALYLPRLSQLLLNFVEPKRCTRRKPVKVQFADEVAEDEDDYGTVCGKDNDSKELRPSFDVPDDYPLQVLLQNVCAVSLKKTRDEHSMPHFSFLASVMSFHSTSALLAYLTRTEPALGKSKIGITFFELIIFPLLSMGDFRTQVQFPSNVTDLVLAACKCNLDDKKQCEDILNRLCEPCTPSVLECLLKKISVYRDDDIFTSWLKNEKLGNTLKELAWKLCSSSDELYEDSDVVWRLLSFCLSTDDNFEPLVSANCLGQILDAFQQTLPKPGSNNCQHFDASLKLVCNLATRLFANAKGCWGICSSEELLLAMFRITCQPPPHLSDEMLEQVQSTWLVGVTALVSVKNDLVYEGSFFHRAASSVQSLVTSEMMNAKSFEDVMTATTLLISKMYECTADASSGNLSPIDSSMSEFCDVLLPSRSTWNHLHENLGNEWLLKAILDDKLTLTEFPTSFDLPGKSTSESYLFLAAFVARTLGLICEEEQKRSLTSSEHLGLVVVHLKDVVCARVLSAMLKNNDRKSSVWTTVNYLPGLVNVLIDKLDAKSTKQLAIELAELSLGNGGLWALCVDELVRNEMFTEKFCSAIEEVEASDQFPMKSSEFHTVLAMKRKCRRRDHLKSLVELEVNCELKSMVQLMALSRRQFEAMGTDELQECVKDVVDVLISWRDGRPDSFLYACDVTAKDWITISFNVEVQKLIAAIVKGFATELQSRHWDFILCGLCSWMQSCHESEKSVWKNLSVSVFITESCHLFKSISDGIESILMSSARNYNHPDLIVEWNEFFSEGIFSILLPLVINFADAKSNSKLSYVDDRLIVSSTVALETIPLMYLQNHRLPTKKATSTEEIEIPENLQILLNHLCPLLGSSVRSVQLCAFRLLQKIIPLLAKCNEKEESLDASEIIRHLPSALQTLLTDTTAVVNAFFAEVVIGSNPLGVLVEPESPMHSYMMSYLLAWSLIMELFSAASSELRSEYAAYLETSGLMHDLLANLFYLIPENAGLQKGYSELPKSSASKSMFSEKATLATAGASSAIELQHQACQVYFQAVKKLPALVRQWWNNQDKHMLSFVERITAKYVSVLLTTEELQSVQSSGKRFENMSVRARITAGEVVATYTIDEVSMELIIKLPPNHPLGPVTVECGKRIGVGNTQWRNWMLQLNTFLTYQNGSILDGLTLWKRNIDKKFEGIEECYICFYVLHGSNCQLPKLLCRTCKKKFHSACLYKWFSTSNQSTCPLCRNLF